MIAIKGLDLIGADPARVEEYRELRRQHLLTVIAEQRLHALIIERGGNIHGVDHKATARRRRNRKVNRAERQRTKSK